MELVEDLVCPRCSAVYQTTDRRTLSILLDHCYLSICPRCTKEVAALMGYTEENISKTLCNITKAKTENNRLKAIAEGGLCKKCEKPFYTKEPRVRENECSNVHTWHMECYKP